MNNFPIPTDNLYKFCSIVGIAGFLILAFILPITFLDTLQSKANEAELQFKLTEAKAEGAKQYADIVKSILKNGKSAAIEDTSIIYDNVSLRKLLETSLEKDIESKELLAKCNFLSTQAKQLIERYYMFRNICYGTALLLLLLSGWGFFKWIHIQLVLDRLLINQVEQLEAEIKFRSKASKSKSGKS